MNPRFFKISIFTVAAIFSHGVAVADVLDAAAGGFTTRNELIVAAETGDVWRSAVVDIAAWWDADHTISGDTSRLSISAVPQGCFCETLGDAAGVVHLTVTMVNPGVVIRLSGGLGPLGLMGVDGNMTWEFEAVEEGTRVTFTYAVGGYRPDGLEAIAGPVDAVLADALQRLKAHAEASKEETVTVD